MRQVDQVTQGIQDATEKDWLFIFTWFLQHKPYSHSLAACSVTTSWFVESFIACQEQEEGEEEEEEEEGFYKPWPANNTDHNAVLLSAIMNVTDANSSSYGQVCTY